MTRPLLAAVGLILVAHSYAWAQGGAPAQDIARSPTPPLSAALKKWEGSSAEFSTYIGSGSFYTSGYHNPYASLALYVRRLPPSGLSDDELAEWQARRAGKSQARSDSAEQPLPR